jgi:8-oxo-dGTP pyrophosphatase MutT (NUDIX family)
MKYWYKKLGRILYWGVWPVSWIYLRRSRRTRLLLMCGDQLLVVNNWLGTGKWSLPGGGLHKGEKPAIGLIRETFEETGIRLDEKTVLPLAVEEFRIHGFAYESHYYAAEIKNKPKVASQPFEITDINWIKRAEVSSHTCGGDVLRALELLDSHRAL